LADCQDQRGTCCPATDHRGSQQPVTIAVGTLAQGDWCEHPDSKRGDFRPGGCTNIHISIVDGKLSFAGRVPAAGQMNGAYRHNPGDRPSAALDGDSVSLELLVEELGHWPGDPPESEIAVFTHTPDHVPRLIQRTDDQPLCRSSAKHQTGIAGPIANGPGQESKQGIHYGLLVTGDGRDRCQSIGDNGKAVALLGWDLPRQCPPDQDAGAKEQRTEHEIEVSSEGAVIPSEVILHFARNDSNESALRIAPC
jgi:hypothetical protein